MQILILIGGGLKIRHSKGSEKSPYRHGLQPMQKIRATNTALAESLAYRYSEFLAKIIFSIHALYRLKPMPMDGYKSATAGHGKSIKNKSTKLQLMQNTLFLFKNKSMRIILVSTLLLIVGCSSRAEEKSAEQSESEHLIASKPNGLTEKKGAMDTLSFDWPKLKTAVRFLNCGSRNNTEKRYLQALKQGQFYYGYCAHNGNQEKTRQINTLPSDSKLIEVIVIKTDGEIGQYTAKNETLQFLQTQIASDDLGTLNWVGKDRSTVMGAFGKPEKDSLNTLCYTGSGGTLILKLSDADTVTALKYYPNRNGESIEIETLNW